MKRIIVALVLVLTSCSFGQFNKAPAGNSIFANSTCALPCWYGISIGKTTKQELLDILQSIPFVNRDSIAVIESTGVFKERVYFTMERHPSLIYAQKSDSVLGVGNIFVLNNKVSQIIFQGDLGLNIQQVVDIFGTPGYAIPFTASGGYIWVEFLSPAQGVDFGYGTNDPGSEITPATNISQLTLFDSILFDEMIQNNEFTFSLTRDPNDLEKYIWEGYGSINMYWYAK